MKKLNIFILVLLALLSSCKKEKAIAEKTTSNTLNTAIESYLKTQQNIHEIPGFAFAVIKNNETIYKGYFGVENIASQKNIDSKTIFPVYSVTKLVTSTAIFKLIEENKLKLDDTIGMYIDDLPEAWQNIRVKHLLTHSSGLPDFISQNDSLSNEEMLSVLKKEELLFEKGDHFRYNQTNYWFLAKIIKKITNTSFEKYAVDNQLYFADHKCFSLSKEQQNSVSKYAYNSQLKKHEVQEEMNFGTRGNPAGGLYVTLDDFILWNTNFDKDSFIKTTTKEQLWQRFQYKNPDDEFLHGWGVYHTNNIDSYGFTGGLRTGFRKFINNDMTIIFLSNGFKFYPIHNNIIDHVAGMVDKRLSDKGALLNEKLSSTFLNETTEKALIEFQKIKTGNPNTNFESTLNSLGYVFMRSNDIEKAIEIFKLNTQEYPTSGNVFDSLGEAYFEAKMYQLSKENYEKSLALDPQNDNAKMMLQKIEKLITKK